jgi:uncharacterized protein (DUF58 family)
MNRQAWRDFFITVFFLGLAFVIALLSSVAADQQSTHLAAIAAAISLVLALIGALYIIPRLARNVRIELLRFAIRTSVTLEGLLFIIFLAIIGFAAWNNGNNLLYLVLSAMLAFLIAANMIARISLADVSIQLRFPDHIFAGESSNISVTLLNHKRFMPSYSLLVQALADEDDKVRDEDDDAAGSSYEAETAQRTTGRAAPASGSGLNKLAYFVLAPARSSARKRIEHTFPVRGCYPITGFRIATKFPAGFFKKWRRIDATGEILVYPKPQPLDDFYHALPMLAGQIQSHARGSGYDLYGIRRYHPSDHMRYIDWKATAKSMAMMVREHMREDEWRLTIVFDTAMHVAPASPARSPSRWRRRSKDQYDVKDSTGKTTDEFRERFERAVLMAASLANHFILERAEVELITIGEQHNVGSGAGQEHLYKILASLATLQPTELNESTDSVTHRPNGSVGSGQTKDGAENQISRSFFGSREGSERRDSLSGKPGGSNATAWRLLDDAPVLRDDRRFKVLITSAKKGTIPGHVWRSAHVVFMEDL